MTQPSALVTDPARCDAEVVNRSPAHMVGLRARVELGALHSFPHRVLPIVGAALQRSGLQPSGPPISLLRARDDGRFDVTAAYPTLRNVAMGLPFVPAWLPGGPAAQALHVGPWSTLQGAYDRLSEWLTAHRVTVVPIMWEEYVVGPDQIGDPAQWRTRVVVPLPTRTAGSGRHG